MYFLCEVFVVMGVQRFVDSRMRKRCHHLKVSQPKVSIATDSQHNLSPCLKNTKNYKKHKRMQWPTLYWKERKIFLDIFLFFSLRILHLQWGKRNYLPDFLSSARVCFHVHPDGHKYRPKFKLKIIIVLKYWKNFTIINKKTYSASDTRFLFFYESK